MSCLMGKEQEEGEERQREREGVVATMSRGQLAFGLAWHVLPWYGLDLTGLGGDQQEAQPLSLMMIIFSNFFVGQRAGCAMTPLPYPTPLPSPLSLFPSSLFCIYNFSGSVSCSLQHMCT